ncbi:MAG TPA: GGDEF domain-containing protein [Gemmatimonadaceae bacterium]|nr:GGDEF domain-containing protein [Gemmatimonadaceae bacterium]
MASPLSHPPSGRQSAFSPLAEGPTEPPTGPSLEIQEALARDQADLQREVILWQRWIRYVAIMLAGGAVLLGASAQDLPVIPLIVVTACYVVCVFATAWIVQHIPASRPRSWLPGLLVTADLVAVGAIFYLTSIPLVTNRFLILATLSVALSAFYFGRMLGSYAAALSIAIYIGIGRMLPPFVPGPQVISLTANVSLFVIVSGVLTYTFGQFRARMNKLRLFCKIVEEGDLSGTLELSKAKYPDDLTLLARSFEAMRNGLAEQIGTDALTSCMNRRALESRLRAEWRLAKRRPNGQLALLAIDLDHFKQINDTRGHPVGDIVLQQLAGIMKSTARDTDAVSRFGGDEFVILLTDTGWQGALTFAERLRRRVDDFTFGPPGNPMTITISVGVALAKGTDPITPDELLKEADRSLYKAKQQGRNRVFA